MYKYSWKTRLSIQFFSQLQSSNHLTEWVLRRVNVEKFSIVPAENVSTAPKPCATITVNKVKPELGMLITWSPSLAEEATTSRTFEQHAYIVIWKRATHHGQSLREKNSTVAKWDARASDQMETLARIMWQKGDGNTAITVHHESQAAPKQQS